MSDLRTSLIIDLNGNLQQRARRWGRSIDRFSRDGEKSLGRFERSADRVNRGLGMLGNRWAGLLTGAAAVATVRQVGSFNDRLLRLGIQANLADDKLDGLKRQILDTANSANVRVDPGQLVDAIDAIVEKTGDLKFAEDNLKNMGVAMQATNAMGADIGELFAEFQKMDIKAPEEVLRAIDILNVQGKEGAFTLQNLARLGPRVVTAYTAAGRGGVEALREMGAALQMIRQGTGSSEMAATAFEATMRTLTDADKIKKLQTLAGIDVYKHLENGEKVLKPINQLMSEIVRTAGGDISRIGSIFDAEAVRAFNSAASEFNRTGQLATLEKFYGVVATGEQTMHDAARGASSYDASMQTLANAWQEFGDNNLAEPVADLADAINSVEPEQFQRWLELGKNLALIGGGIWLAGKARQRLRSATQRGGAGGMAGAGGGLGGGMSGPVPVYVVNQMPGAGATGAGGKGRAGRYGQTGRTAGGGVSTRSPTKASRLGTAGRLAGNGLLLGEAFGGGYMLGSLINEGITMGLSKLTGSSTSLGSEIYDLFNDDSKLLGPTTLPKQEVGGELTIRIDQSGRARVTNLDKRGNMDLNVDTGVMMRGD
ncbi:MAG TPA: hypothetical protein DCS18_16235 [Alcanivorax sp.]|nr:hypothetical protein [Alcanivorax sp.]HAV68720.1 hypothetical protein [Alcanivorax sp.]|tara:strand:- start:52748 stop:54541 length:1794 start_codon:yes stop_codon:yes gene_type:complete